MHYFSKSDKYSCTNVCVPAKCAVSSVALFLCPCFHRQPVWILHWTCHTTHTQTQFKAQFLSFCSLNNITATTHTHTHTHSSLTSTHKQYSEKEGHPLSLSASPRKPDGIATMCIVVMKTDDKRERQKDTQTWYISWCPSSGHQSISVVHVFSGVASHFFIPLYFYLYSHIHKLLISKDRRMLIWRDGWVKWTNVTDKGNDHMVLDKSII